MLRLKPHNQQAVDTILSAYQQGSRRVLYVSGVGTGKSFVFLGTAENIPGRILYVVPKYAVQENITAYHDFASVESRVDFVTFNQFADRAQADKLLAGHDLVVIDECHHLGSDRYGRVLSQAMLSDTSTRRYLGLTATPVRYKIPTLLPSGKIDRNVNVSVFFDRNVNGISTFDAIRLGMMPPFQYRLMLPDKDPKQIEKEYDHQVRAVVDYEKNDAVLQDILQTYSRDKWIVFFPSVKDLKQNREKMQNLFPGYSVFELYANLNNLKDVLKGVSESKKAVILSVNMLLEGVHLPNITGIILYRNVTSVGTFQQMLGRVCSIGNTVSPLVIDCSGCGPKLLRKLIASNSTNDSEFAQESGAGKPIMTIGIGAHKKWESIDEFLRRSMEIARESAMVPAPVCSSILSDYFSFGGHEYGNSADLNMKDKKILQTVCWKYDVPVEKFVGQVTALKRSIAC